MPSRLPPPPRPGVDAAKAAVPPRPVQLSTPNPDTRALKRAHKLPERKPGPSKRATFTVRHQLIMYMELAGERVSDIALKLGMHPSSVSAIKASPLYQVHRAQLLESLTQNKLDSFLDFIRNDAVKNVEFAVKVRDSELEETKNRLGAARMMQKEADRVFPRITKSHHTEERTVRITLGQERLARIAGAMAEIGALAADGIIDAEMFDPNAPDAPPLISAQSIDDLREELLDAAETALDE